MSRHNSSIILNWPNLLLRGAALSSLAGGPFTNPRTRLGFLRILGTPKSVHFSVSLYMYILYYFCIYKTSLPDSCVPRISSKIATLYLYRCTSAASKTNYQSERAVDRFFFMQNRLWELWNISEEIRKWRNIILKLIIRLIFQMQNIKLIFSLLTSDLT